MFTSRNPFPYSLHSRRQRHRRRHGKPDSHRNIPSAFFGLVVTGLFAVTMAEPNWFHLHGGQCTGKHIGLYTIFGMNMNQLKDQCISYKILTKLRVCAALSLVGVICSMLQFAIDVCGANRFCIRWMRRNAVGHILSVLLTISLMGLSYWITLDVQKLKIFGSIHIKATFDVAFYLIVASGIAAFFATCLSLLQITCERRERRHRHGSDMQLQLIYGDEDVDVMMESMPPVAPPAYQP